jgi:exodeoxyribonuclease-5
MNGEPNIMLTEIMRQALDNPIIRWSMKVREGEVLPFAREGTCRKVMRSKVSPEALFGLGYMVLTGKNETRRALNRQARKLRGYDSIYPVAGEQLVMLQNHKDFGVLNGVLCETIDDARVDLYHEFLEVWLHYEGERKEITLCTSQFNAYDKPARADDIDFNKRWKTPADFGYALTVHKAQGSQWPGVALIDDGLNKGKGVERNRWIYTAITRAERDLLIVA